MGVLTNTVRVMWKSEGGTREAHPELVLRDGPEA
jgi:hypothetical protein